MTNFTLLKYVLRTKYFSFKNSIELVSDMNKYLRCAHCIQVVTCYYSNHFSKDKSPHAPGQVLAASGSPSTKILGSKIFHGSMDYCHEKKNIFNKKS